MIFFRPNKRLKVLTLPLPLLPVLCRLTSGLPDGADGVDDKVPTTLPLDTTGFEAPKGVPIFELIGELTDESCSFDNTPCLPGGTATATDITFADTSNGSETEFLSFRFRT
jgi:hypothetical protein